MSDLVDIERMFAYAGSMVLGAIRDELAELAAGFDPAVASAETCAKVLADAVAIEKLVGTVKALAAARVAETDLWRGEGDRSAAHHLARHSGTSVRDANETITAGKQLGAAPALDKAARAGDLSTAQAAAIADAVGVAGAQVAERLVTLARRVPLAELREECLRTKAAACDVGETHRKVKAARRLRTWIDGEGGWNLAVRDTVDAGAEIMAVLDKLRDKRFRSAHRDGRTEPSEAYGADALLDMARRAAGSGGGEVKPLRDTKIIVRVDWDALVRGWPIDGEVCDIPGLGPVPVSVVRAMIETGDVFLSVVVTRGHDVHTVAHLGRAPTAYQQTGLDWLQPTCIVETCHSPARLQIDHRHDWATTKVTLLRWLDRLCTHHHDLKTRNNWMLVDGQGRRPMVPPDDPRHPNRAGPLAA
jgi:hypothetical protein